MIKTKNQLYLWIGIALVGVALCVVLIVALCKPAPEPAPTTVATTEATLPPLAPNVYGPEDIGYAGDYLTCLTGESVMGIDVSTHQKDIDWQQVKDAGVEFAMIRIGYRGSIEGVLFPDEWSQRHYEGAKAAGLKVGGYFFSQSITPEEAVQEAKYAMDLIQGWQLDMPLVYDFEIIQSGYRTDVMTPRLLTDCAKAFCDTVAQAGYQPMIYFNSDQSRDDMYLEELTPYGFWLAMYNDQMTYEYKVDMWQYTNTGSIPGIDGNVDINLHFTYPE